MAATYRNYGTIGEYNGTGIVVNLPADTAVGDLVTAVMSTNGALGGNASISAASGWTQIYHIISPRGNLTLAAFYMRATISGTQQFVFPLSGTSYGAKSSTGIFYSSSGTNPASWRIGNVQVNSQMGNSSGFTNPGVSELKSGGTVFNVVAYNANAGWIFPDTNVWTVSFGSTGGAAPHNFSYRTGGVGGSGTQFNYSDSGYDCAAISFAATEQNLPTTPGSFTFPASGSTHNKSIPVTWGVSTDADGDGITYDLDYWNGSSWNDLSTGAAASYNWDVSSLPAGTAYKVRVRAFDGYGYSAFTESSAFNVNHQTNQMVI